MLVIKRYYSTERREESHTLPNWQFPRSPDCLESRIIFLKTFSAKKSEDQSRDLISARNKDCPESVAQHLSKKKFPAKSAATQSDFCQKSGSSLKIFPKIHPKLCFWWPSNDIVPDNGWAVGFIVLVIVFNLARLWSAQKGKSQNFSDCNDYSCHVFPKYM